MRRPAWLRDAATPSLLLFAVIALVGVVGMLFAWRSAAGTPVLAYQVPALVSGALGGMALVLIGGVLFSVQAGRRLAVDEREKTDAVLKQALLIREELRR